MNPSTPQKAVATVAHATTGNEPIALDETQTNNILKKSDEYFGWTVHTFNSNEVLLSRNDAGTGGQQFLPLKQADIQRLYDEQKPNTMKVKG